MGKHRECRNALRTGSLTSMQNIFGQTKEQIDSKMLWCCQLRIVQRWLVSSDGCLCSMCCVFCKICSFCVYWNCLNCLYCLYCIYWVHCIYCSLVCAACIVCTVCAECKAPCAVCLVSRGLRPTLLRKWVPTSFVVEGVVIRCSCILLQQCSRIGQSYQKIFWKPPGSSIGSPWPPKCVQVEKQNIKSDFLLPLSGDNFEILSSGKSGKEPYLFSSFLRPSLGWYFYDLWSISGEFLETVISQYILRRIKDVKEGSADLFVVYSGIIFSESFLQLAFCCSGFVWVTSGSLLVFSDWFWRYRKMMQNKWQEF